ncbi:MAG: rhamnulokinase [Verrucomicrobia bacterium]|nr:rhamnulokinase [Verrucomicrobiota bacterium]
MPESSLSKVTTVAAIDLGATSGRIIVGQYTGEQLKLTEVHRFPNSFYELGNNCYWNLGGLWQEIRKGLEEAHRLFPDLKSVGVDTWGVDHVFLDKNGRLLAPTYAYRDQRTQSILNRIRASGDGAKLYEWTGLPAINYNTALQIQESLQVMPALRDYCARVLTLPDYFNYLLSGVQVNEISHASTTQLLDVSSDDYSSAALEYFNIPRSFFGKPQRAGICLGPVSGISDLGKVQVALVPGHDTSGAFEAIPQDGNSLIVSSGTWLLAGALTQGPCLGKAALDLGISNERTGTGGYRPNKILLGLWLLERIQLSFGLNLAPKDWDAVARQASDLQAPATLLDLSDESLFNPKDMRSAIDAQLHGKGAKAPTDLPGYTRLIAPAWLLLLHVPQIPSQVLVGAASTALSLLGVVPKMSCCANQLPMLPGCR